MARPDAAQPPSRADDDLGLAVDELVLADAPARRVLYTWTTEEQAAELRRTPVLLTRSARSDGTPTKLSQAIASLAATDDPLAKVLAGPDFQKGRFGWPSAWPTLLGWPGESYGTALLRVELKPEAWTARLLRGELAVYDAENKLVDTATVLRNPERIAAVYFVNRERAGGDGFCGSFVDCAPSAYREYFINNERMIAEWSLTTQTILAELDRSRALVDTLLSKDQLRDWLSKDACRFSGSALCEWEGQPSLGNRYMQALALPSENYLPTEENLRALGTALEAARFALDPFVHVP